MGGNAWILCCVVCTVSMFSGCAGGRSAKDSRTAAPVRDTIQGKTQINLDETSQTDKAMNAGGPSVHVIVGMRPYRLFLKTPFDIEAAKEYRVEGIYAQKVIDELGDPDNGSNGYPLLSSCQRVVKTAWPGMAMDVTGGYAQTLRDKVRRYPARPVFLVTRIEAVAAKEDKSGSAEAKKSAGSSDADAPELSVPAEKQLASFIEGPTVQQAPLWEPGGRTIRCKVQINPEGKVSELQSGAQLCESVPWAQFRYRPTVDKGRPAKVNTEVEIRFEPRKT